MSSIPDAAPVPNVSKAFAEEFKALTVAMSRSATPLASGNFAAVIGCVRCGHIGADHRHGIDHECPTDPRLAERDLCPYTCTAVGCTCPDMAWSQRDLHCQEVIAEQQARLAMLTDAVVAAAALYFNQIDDPRERDYASEALHETAAERVAAEPRLRGTFDPQA